MPRVVCTMAFLVTAEVRSGRLSLQPVAGLDLSTTADNLGAARSAGSWREHTVEALNLALGTMFFGTRLDERTCFDLLDRFVADGGTLIDTANSYAFWADRSEVGGQSESVVGRWLASRHGMREHVYLSTKVGAEPTRPGEWPANAEGLSAAAIRAASQGSLRRLRTDWIDLYWAHMEDRSVPVRETV